MISRHICQPSLIAIRACRHRFALNLNRFASTTPKGTSSSPDKSSSKGKSDSKYLADDMYNYTTFSHYDIEASMTKYRLAQPSSYASLKPESGPQKK